MSMRLGFEKFLIGVARTEAKGGGSWVRYLRGLIPNKSDWVCIVFLLLMLAGVMLPATLSHGLHFSRVYLMDWVVSTPYAAILIGIVASLGCWSWTTICRRWILVVAVVASFGLMLGLAGLLSEPMWYEPRTRSNEEIDYILGPASVLAFLCVATFVATRILNFIFRRWRTRVGTNDMTRARGLVYCAIALLAWSMIYRFLQSDYRDSLYLLNQVADFPLVILMTPVVLGAIPAMLIHYLKRSWWSLSLGLYLFAISFVCVNLLTKGGVVDGRVAIWAFGIYSLLLWFVLWALRDRHHESNDANEVDQAKRSGRPSIWGIGVCMAAIGAVVGVFVYEPFTIYESTTNDRFKVARVVRQMQLSPGTEAKISVDRWNGLGVSVKFSDDSTADFFEGYRELAPLATNIQFKKMKPHIDVEPLLGHSLSWSVGGGEMTLEQINQLASLKSWYTSISNVVIVGRPVDSNRQLISWSSFVLSQLKAKDLELILANIQTTDVVTNIKLRDCKYSEGVWNEIFRLSEFHPVQVDFDQLTPQVVEASLAHNTKYLGFEPYQYRWGLVVYEPLESEMIWRVLLDSNLHVFLVDPAGYSRALQGDLEKAEKYSIKFWDAIFAADGSAELLPYGQVEFDETRALRDFCVKHHWAYSENATIDNIENLFVPRFDPQMIFEIAKIAELRNLSFDNRWLAGTRKVYDFRMFQIKVDVSALGKLTRLESLIFPRRIDIEDLFFISRLKNLKHLQYDCFSEKAMNFRANQCPQLESLYLYSWPQPWLVREVGKLKNLERFVIVNMEDDPRTPNDIDLIKRLLPADFPVEIVESNESKPEIPQSFLDHVERVKTEVRKKYIE